MGHFERLLVIADAGCARTPAIERAAAIAARSGAALHLLIVGHAPGLAGARGLNTHATRELRDRYVAERQAWLEQEAARLRAQGIRATASASHAAPVMPELLLQIRELQPDLVIKDVHFEPLLRRVLFGAMDWSLLQESPVPVLLVNGEARTLPRRVIAAVDTALGAACPAADLVIAESLAVAIQCDAELHLAHAFEDAAALRTLQGSPLVAPNVSRALLELDQRAFDAIAERYGVPSNRRHFVAGAAGPALCELCNDAGADMIVVGIEQHHGLERLLKGHTAQGMLERLGCDLLAVQIHAARSRRRLALSARSLA